MPLNSKGLIYTSASSCTLALILKMSLSFKFMNLKWREKTKQDHGRGSPYLMDVSANKLKV